MEFAWSFSIRVSFLFTHHAYVRSFVLEILKAQKASIIFLMCFFKVKITGSTTAYTLLIFTDTSEFLHIFSKAFIVVLPDTSLQSIY